MRAEGSVLYVAEGTYCAIIVPQACEDAVDLGGVRAYEVAVAGLQSKMGSSSIIEPGSVRTWKWPYLRVT